MVGPPLLASFLQWADHQPGVRVVTLFGALARGAATASSDVDLQVVTTRPGLLLERGWTRQLKGHRLHAYAVRAATGGVHKATGLFDTGEIDLVIIPYSRLRLARTAVALGLHRRSRSLAAALAQMTLILRPGHEVLRGGAGWTRFYRTVVDEVPDPRLDDAEVRSLAETLYVDAFWITRKVAQGELVAAQRWLHRTPAEVNFRLLNEWRARRGERLCFDARRAEQVLPPLELSAVTLNAPLEPAALQAAARQSVTTARWLVRELTGSSPEWPEL